MCNRCVGNGGRHALLGVLCLFLILSGCCCCGGSGSRVSSGAVDLGAYEYERE
jgi:hypothetical protein